MKKTALVIMAAGIGSRFGKGIKQLEPVGPSGEIIMDYSIHDALEAGFNKIVFVIRRDLEEDFKRIIGERIEKIAEVAYAYQELDDLPEGFTKPENRTKPWGTGQAVLCAKEVLQEPFAVINADDYYGKEPFVKLHEYLVQEHSAPEGVQPICMAGFVLGNTLSDNGGVTRGICRTDKDGNLIGIDETSNIVRTEQGAAVQTEEGLTSVDQNSLVSMNMWGFQPEFLELLKEGFVEFLSKLDPKEAKGEYLLPIYVDELLQAKKGQVRVLPTQSIWFGVTYQEDKASVVEAFKKLIADGVYDADLYA
ncbi:MAG: sugar phosphate nucleotidyltransferase [Lachnospiraceae bacterium]|nr:sugar phosphate nucleotidyltransferase [Lachnospiraceae bacterium]